MTIYIESIQIRTDDGTSLAANLFLPLEDRDRCLAVQIHPATAVQQGIYRKFATFLAEEGCTVVTFDYRGTGDSLQVPIRDFDGRMRDWGERDVPAVTNWVTEHYPRHRHLVVAHSVGGQILGLASNSDRLEGVLGICVQWGSWIHWPIPRRWLHKVLFHVLAPPLIAACGYFPGRWLGMGDLPAGIGGDWMQWCRSRHYICDDRGEPLRPYFDRLRCPVRWIGFSDDPVFGPRKAIEAMPSLYPSARHEVQVIDPASVGSPIGHFGFFRSRFRDNLWRQSAEWLKETAAATP